MKVLVDRSRSILTENVVEDVDYRWTANPYRGCEHACAACYARGSHEYLDLGAGEEFDRTIVVKEDAPAQLRAAFEAAAWKGETITFSSVTDPYQPIEERLGLTRRCLEVCLEYRNPVRIATRSPLVLRDVDLLRALGDEARCSVVMSIAFSDAEMSSKLEPGAALPDERARAIGDLAAAGIDVGVMVAPVICGLNDAQLISILERAAAAGAKHACWALLRLPEPTATVFRERLATAVPHLAHTLLRRAAATRGPDEPGPFHTRGNGGGAYVAAIEAAFAVTTARLGLEKRRFAKSVEPATTFRRAQLSLF